MFSAKLRLPASVSATVLSDFVEEIMDVVELTPLRGALVGLPGNPSRKSTRLNSSHSVTSRMPSSA